MSIIAAKDGDATTKICLTRMQLWVDCRMIMSHSNDPQKPIYGLVVGLALLGLVLFVVILQQTKYYLAKHP